MHFHQIRTRKEDLSFEQVTHRLGLNEDEYLGSSELKEWVSRHKNEKYVPEYLLKAWGLMVDTREI